MSGFGTSSSVVAPGARGGLPASRCAGRQSATAAAAISTSQSAKAAAAAACICNADTTGTTVTPIGGSSSTGPNTSVARCPAATAAMARANPMRPELPLLRNRNVIEVFAGRARRDQDGDHCPRCNR